MLHIGHTPQITREHHTFSSSTRVDEAWYDRARRECTVRFPDGIYYRYSGVPAEVWKDFITAESAGRYLNEVLAEKYDGRHA